jgi:hypothetical protein
MLRTCTEYETDTRIAPTEATGVYPFVLHLVCAEYVLGTFGVTSAEIRLKLFYPNCIV